MSRKAHVRCGVGEKPEVVTPEAYLSLFGQIPKFDKLIATIRSREISASIILQSQSQLKTIYKDAADGQHDGLYGRHRTFGTHPESGRHVCQ